MSESTEPRLLPCPMCGSNNIEVINTCKERSDNKWVVMCIDCFVQTYGGGYTKAEARAAWNRRPAPQWSSEPPTENGLYLVCNTEWDHYDIVHANDLRLNDAPEYAWIVRGDHYQFLYEVYEAIGADKNNVLWLKIELPALPEKGGTDE